MFRVIKCIKCGHVMAGEDVFIQKFMERYNQNTKKIKRAYGPYLRELVQENAMLRSYMRQILHWQNEQIVHSDLDSYKLQSLIKFIKDKKLITDDEMQKILDRAKELQNIRLQKDGEKLKELYGEFESILSNKSNSDPTANSAIGSVMKGVKNNGGSKDI